MGYVTVAYGVDIDRLRAVEGSGDKQLLAQIEQECQQELARLDEARISRRGLVARKALEQIISVEGKDTSSDARALYIYVVELICRCIGERLDGHGHIRYLDDLGWDTAANMFSTPLDLGEPFAFPNTSFLTHAQVVDEHARFRNAEMDDDDHELVEAREEFVWWLKQCADKGLGLVTFCY